MGGEKKKYELNGKEYERAEYVRLLRAEKKSKLNAYRKEHNIDAPVKKDFDLNNEKVWFKNTYRQVKVQLVNNFVKRMRYFRFTLDKLNKTDTSTLSEKDRNTVEAKKRRCTNGEKHKEKEMYLIKSWKYNEVFNMLIENEPIDFEKASEMTDSTGDFKIRARERIRTHPLVKPIWEKINRNLNLFEEDRTVTGESKSKKLTKEVLKNEKKIQEERMNTINAGRKDDEIKDSMKSESDKPSTNDNRFSMDAFNKIEEKIKSETIQPPKEQLKSAKEEPDEFNEYSSDEDDEDQDENEENEISENEEGGFDIEFVMPKFLSEKKTEKNEKSEMKSLDGEVNDFFINEGEAYNEPEDEQSDSSSEEEDDGQNGGFFLENDKVVKLKSNLKTDSGKKKTGKDNREGQRERKKHAKAVYGKHVEVVEKQEKKFRERNKKRKGEKTVQKKEDELHPSWAASKKAKQENKIHKFEGKKVTFDSDSE